MKKVTSRQWDFRAARLSLFQPPIWGDRDPSDPTGRRCKAKVPERSVTLGEVYDYLRSQEALAKWREARRSIGEKKLWQSAKARTLPFVCFQGELAQQGDSQMVAYSRMGCIDIDLTDDVCTDELKRALANDPVLAPLMVFRSPGYGVKVVTRCSESAAGYESHYEAQLNYIASVYGIECDAKCRNISRVCYLGFDAQPIMSSEI